MDFEKQTIEELREYKEMYSGAKETELADGYELSKKVKEFDNPEDYLSENELFLLSQFYEYMNIIESKSIEQGDDYIFDEEDID